MIYGQNSTLPISDVCQSPFLGWINVGSGSRAFSGKPSTVAVEASQIKDLSRDLDIRGEDTDDADGNGGQRLEPRFIEFTVEFLWRQRGQIGFGPFKDNIVIFQQSLSVRYPESGDLLPGMGEAGTEVRWIRSHVKPGVPSFGYPGLFSTGQTGELAVVGTGETPR